MACINSSIVGVVAIRDAKDASWIDQLYVDPEFCGRGIGTQLLTFALSGLRRPVHLYTFQPNALARTFYEAHGFRPVEFGVQTSCIVSAGIAMPPER